MRPKRDCMEPGCGALIEAPAVRCAAHKRESPAALGYDRSWRVLREAYARTHPDCEPCLEEGKQVAMAIVDHRVPIKDGGPRLDPRNLQSLCWSCHSIKTHRETRARAISFRSPPILPQIGRAHV